VIDGVTYRDITIKGAACPIFIHVINRRRSGDPNQKIGAIRNINISNVSVSGCKPAKRGLLRTSALLGRRDSYLENITLENVKMFGRGGSPNATNTTDLKIEPVQPAQTMLPAAGLYVRHARALTLKNVELAFETPDPRPPLAVYDVIGLSLDHFKAHKTGDGMVRLEMVKDFSVHNSPALPDRELENVPALSE
jgi:hypothetical protein